MIREIQGSGGSLDAFQIDCPDCGLELKNTVRSNLEKDFQEHREWHDKRVWDALSRRREDGR